MRTEFDMATDDRLLELFRVAEARRRWNRMVDSLARFRDRVNWWVVGALLLIAAPWVIFYGVARALDKGF